MKNLFSKSHLDFDFQKFFNLILTEQRAQRVDLARLTKMLHSILDNMNSIPSDEYQEQPDDISDSRQQ